MIIPQDLNEQLCSPCFGFRPWYLRRFSSPQLPVVVHRPVGFPDRHLDALSRNLPISLFCLGLMGLSYVTLETNNSAIIQSTVPDELRGRVIGLFTLMYTGGEPLGALAVGLLAARTSESFTFYICSVGMMLYSILIWFRRPEVRVIN